MPLILHIWLDTCWSAFQATAVIKEKRLVIKVLAYNSKRYEMFSATIKRQIIRKRSQQVRDFIRLLK